MKRWYVAQVYAGYEEAIKADLLRHIAEVGSRRIFWRSAYSFCEIKANV